MGGENPKEKKKNKLINRYQKEKVCVRGGEEKGVEERSRREEREWI